MTSHLILASGEVLNLDTEVVAVGILDELYRRHGGPYDRGSADAYYGRPRRPHYFKGASYQSEEVTEKDMVSTEILAYNLGYDECDDRKDWG